MALRIAEQGRTALLVELPRPIGGHSIAKVRTRRARVNNPVQRRVNELDPRGERFALAQNKLLKGVFNKTQTRALEAAANEPLRQVVTLMPRSGVLLLQGFCPDQGPNEGPPRRRASHDLDRPKVTMDQREDRRCLLVVHADLLAVRAVFFEAVCDLPVLG